MRKFLKVFGVASALIIALAGFASCSGGAGFEFDEYTDYEPFRFYAYMTPPPANVGTGILSSNPDCMTDEHYKAIADCGFNWSIGIYDGGSVLSKKAMAGLQPYGVKHLVVDGGFHQLAADLQAGNNTDTLVAELKSRLAEYKQFDSFGGIYADDESAQGFFPYLGQARELIGEDLDGYLWWYNLNPIGASGKYPGTYKQYVEAAATLIGGERISFDSYPLFEDGSMKTGHYANSMNAAVVAREYGQPWDAFILTMGHHSYRTPKNYADIAWQVYGHMAFGAQGIETFTYWTTLTTGENVTYGLCDYYGNKTQTWYSMQEVIKEVRAFESMYMNSTWEGTMIYVADEDYPNDMLYSLPVYFKEGEEEIPNPYLLNEHGRIASMKGDIDFMMGAFKDADGRDAFLLCNVADPADNVSGKVTLKFNDASKAVIYKKGRKITVNLKNGELKTKLGAGEGYYIIPLK